MNERGEQLDPVIAGQLGSGPEMDWHAILRETGADLFGHFVLTTGLHSNRFFLMARLTEHPRWLRLFAEAMAARLAPFRPTVVVGSAMGGVIPAYAVGEQLDPVRVMFAEKTQDGSMSLLRGFRIAPDDRVVALDDAVSTGSSLRKVMAAVRAQGGRVVAAAALVDRSVQPIELGVPFVSVTEVRDSWLLPADRCPLCRQGTPVVHPKF